MDRIHLFVLASYISQNAISQLTAFWELIIFEAESK